jgi:pimeloyl-ACP methyl ester carboxylesterase
MTVLAACTRGGSNGQVARIGADPTWRRSLLAQAPAGSLARMRWRVLALTLSVSVAALGMSVACTSKPATPKQAPTLNGVATGPEGAAFYNPPPAPANAKPGDLIWGRPLAGPAGSQGAAILYWSTTVDGKLVAVSGVVFEPVGSRPARPRPILAWAHGTFGLGDQCAPSQGYFQGNGASAPIVQVAVRAGAVFVASDYQGLGTPGDHPFMVSQAAGRNVLDSIRAAARYTGAGAGSDTQAAVLGQSQGAAAALLAAELQPTYAPELRLHGAVAISAPSGLDKLDGQLSGGHEFGYVLMTVYGFEAAYPELVGRDKALTPAGQAALARIPGECLDKILADNENKTLDEYGIKPVLHAPDFSTFLRKNDPGYQKSTAPILIVHGEKDDTIPVQNTRDLVQRYCALGVTVAVRYYPDYGHVDVLGAALPVIVKYLNERMVGSPAPTSCAAGQTP